LFESLRFYLHWSQMIFIGAFVAWWLLGAAWLLQKSLRRHAGIRYPAMGTCVLSLFLAGLGAMVAGGLTYQLGSRFGERTETSMDVRLLAAIPAMPLAAGMAILILYATYQLPLRRLLRVTWLPLTSVAVAAVLTGAPAFWLGWSQRRQEGKAGSSVANLVAIDAALREYSDKYFPGQAPDRLETLASEFRHKDSNVTLLRKANLECPFLPGVPVGYFYYPSLSGDPNLRSSRAIRACEWTHPDSERYRAVLFANGNAMFNPDQDFQSILALPENARFAQLFRAADANRR